MCLQSKDEISIFLQPGVRHIGYFRELAEQEGKPLPISISIGVDPAIEIASCFEPPTTPLGYDELQAAGALRQQPVELVNCLTIQERAIANAEYVIEGEILPGVRVREDQNTNTGTSLALCLILCTTMLWGCGNKEGSPSSSADPNLDYGSVAGTYLYEESAMGGQLTVEWELKLADDGSYVLTETGPMGATAHKGTYTFEGNIVTTGPFDGQVKATFFEKDNSCQWILEGDTCTPKSLSEDAGDETNTETPAGQTDAAVEPNEDSVAYASNSKSQVCDIYLPEGDGPYPVIVIYHGGGFQFGDQKMDIIQPVITTALSKGYAVVSADYRKASEAVFPAAVADAKAVIRFVRANGDKYQFDTEQITVWGESAGAYLAVMTALTPDESQLDGDVTDNAQQDESVKSLVDFYGPVEFYTMDQEYKDMGQEENATHSTNSFECKFLGIESMTGQQEEVDKSYWKTYENKVPSELSVWIQAGTADVQVPNTQSQNLAKELTKKLGDNQVSYSLIEGAGHEDSLFYTGENLDKVFEFLKK